jgi:hypothetical protein
VPSTLFIVWDPERLVQDDERFQKDVESNGSGIFCRVLRSGLSWADAGVDNSRPGQINIVGKSRRRPLRVVVT